MIEAGAALLMVVFSFVFLLVVIPFALVINAAVLVIYILFKAGIIKRGGALPPAPTEKE
jgi:hypothetical protein